MPLSDYVTIVTLTGPILDPITGGPATGRVSASMPYVLRDADDNVVVGRGVFSEVLDEDGNFSLEIPATNDPTITPSGWVYTIKINTNVWKEKFFIQVPYDTPGGVLNLADVTPSETPPAVVTYATAIALAAHEADTTNIHGIANTALLETTAGSAAKVAAHEADTTSVHGIADTSALETQAGATAKVTAHTVAVDPHADRAYTDTVGNLKLAKASNLSDVASPSTSRTNLGLGNVDNTSDANKPISTATQAALDLKAAATTLNVKTFGAVGNGVADDTAAIVAAFTAANALVRSGATGTIKHPGAKVLIPAGVYSLTSLSSVIDVMCNVESEGATFLVPAAYAGTVLRVGHATSGNVLQAARIVLPDVVKPTSTAIVAGSIGVTVQNLYSSDLTFGRTAYFETGLNFTGLGEGTVYNRVHTGWIGYCKISLQLKPSTAGWVNQNNFTGGGIQQSAGYAGGVRQSGWRHLVLDGAGINSVNGNNFIGVSFEGDVSEYAVYVRHAYQNNFYGCRHEAGTAFAAVTVSGSTLTRTAHGLAVGDMIVPTASVAPTGMDLLTPYYVIAVPDANTFTIARKKGGTAITFGSSGTNVTYARPHRIYFDTSGAGVSENVIRNPVNPLYWLDIVHSTAIATGNQLETAAYKISDFYLPEDLPQFRGRNAYSGATARAIFAAYASGVNPVEDPAGWAVALSDRGIVWNAGTVIRTGTSSPEGVVTAPIGSVFLRTDGSTGTTLYMKESGSGNTGWAAHGALDADLAAIAALTPSADDLLQYKSGAWTNRTPAQVKTDLVLTAGDVGAFTAIPGGIGQSGHYFTINQSTVTTQPLTGSYQILYAFPYYCPTAVAVDRIAVEVTTLGTGVLRQGIYSHNSATGLPLSNGLIADFGTVDVTSPGIKETTISTTIPAGWHWYVHVWQTDNATAPTLRVASVAPGYGPFTLLSSAATAMSAARTGYSMTGVSGTLGTLSLTATAGIFGPRLAYRRA